MKLRTCGRGAAELIRYDRPEDGGVRTSDYEVTPVRDARRQAVPGAEDGEPIAVVRKRRELLLLDNVRIHLDEVDGLGTFLELEAVRRRGARRGHCRGQVDRLLSRPRHRRRDLRARVVR